MEKIRNPSDRSSCTTGAQTDIRNEIFTIGFGMCKMETELTLKSPNQIPSAICWHY